MTDNEYYANYMQDIYARAGSMDDFTEEQFTEEMCDFLVDQAVVESYDSSFFKKTHLGIRIDAWYYQAERHELDLFICDYEITPDLRVLTQSDVDNHLKRAERFLAKSLSTEYYHEIEESLPIYSVARTIYKSRELITKVKIILLSNASLSSRFKGLESRSLLNLNMEYDIWDMSRRNRIDSSGKAKEDIVIDFTEFVEGGIHFLPAYGNSSSYKSFLMVFPGKMLADIYDKYGERLLEQNVRTFLQFRGGVNKGIRNTLSNEPEMFFAYNNGLTLTAEETNVEGTFLKSVTNMQIVNGGQTTASIFMAKMLNRTSIDLENVHVQVKMTVIEPEKVDDVVPVISKCANTQNKVSAADFFSNHPYHKRIEDFSRAVLAPSGHGSLTETYWFYERARGQYGNRQAKMPLTQKKKFLLQNPRHQMFTKTDLAKYENSFAQMPHFVSKGAQWNFAKYAEEISGKEGVKKGLWEENELQFNKLYYKQLIAKAIVFRQLDKNIMKQPWYAGYKANIVTYTIAKFAHMVAHKGKFIDFLSIWRKQQMSDAMEAQLLDIADRVNDIITDTDENVTQYCKKNDCWESVKAYALLLDEEVIAELIRMDKKFEQKVDAKKEQKSLNAINAQIEVYNRGLKYWTAMLDWASNSIEFSNKEMSILSTTLRLNTSPPSEKQSVVLLQIEQKAIEEGFSFKE
ncbi:MAG: AIPR family protein [Gammaproteobacteria bacterium]|nr:AIPR family protein [Gammaproteobacteria bacterium]